MNKDRCQHCVTRSHMHKNNHVKCQIHLFCSLVDFCGMFLRTPPSCIFVEQAVSWTQSVLYESKECSEGKSRLDVNIV